MTACHSRSASKVEKGVENDPDRIDEVPVESHALYGRTLHRDDPPTEKNKDKQHNANADRKVDGVNAGHDPIECPENLGCWRRQREIRPREEVFLEILAVLK